MALALAEIIAAEPPSVAPTTAARCPICSRVLGVIHGTVLTIERGGRPIAQMGATDPDVAIPCVTRICFGIWRAEPESIACERNGGAACHFLSCTRRGACAANG